MQFVFKAECDRIEIFYILKSIFQTHFSNILKFCITWQSNFFIIHFPKKEIIKTKWTIIKRIFNKCKIFANVKFSRKRRERTKL